MSYDLHINVCLVILYFHVQNPDHGSNRVLSVPKLGTSITHDTCASTPRCLSPVTLYSGSVDPTHTLFLTVCFLKCPYHTIIHGEGDKDPGW